MDNKENNQDIEVVIGDDSMLNISEVGDFMNDLKPKTSEKKSKNVIIPKNKKIDDDKEENNQHSVEQSSKKD